MTMRLLGLGLATPEGAIDQPLAAAMAEERCCQTPQEARLLRAIYRQTTVDRRGSVLLGGNGENRDSGERGNSGTNGDAERTPAAARIDAFFAARVDGDQGPPVSERMRQYVACAPGLAVRAAGDALQEAGVAPGDVAQLVCVSCTGFVSPGLDFTLIDALGLSPTVGRTLIGFMGCHGAVNGLRVADALAVAQPGRPVLLVCVELCSLHFQYGWDPQQVVANALFADGAAAAVGVAEAAGEGPRARPAGLTVAATGSCVVPGSSADMTWTIGDHGFRMSLSPRVPRLIERHLRPWLERWLGEQGLAVGDVGSWAIHPGGPRIIDAAVEALGLPAESAEASRAVLREHGNMSSPTVLFILERLMRSGGEAPCVLLAFGPGLVAEAALLR